MKFLQNFISKLRKPICGGVFVVVCLTVLLVPDLTFAQGTDDVNGWIVNLVKLVSRLWIIPASIAGKLMTNSIAFGSAFFLDTYLFKMWQFMRTMALYTLGFIFVFKILVVFVKQEELKNLGSLVGKTAIAGLLIPMSWFMMTALVDFSIIGTSAVASLPLQVIKGQWQELDGKLTCYKKVRVKANKTVDIADLNSDLHVLTLEDVMPSGDSLAGPMIFMGCGMLNLFDFNNLTSKSGDIGDIAFKGSLKLLISFMLVMPMIVLMVVNMMRVFFIWLRAMFGPLIILDTVFKGPLTGGDGEYAKYFKISNILGLVFQPVAVVGLMSVSMVLLLGVYGGLTGEKKNLEESGGMQQTMGFYPTGTNSARIGDGVNSEVHMDGSLFAKSAKAWVGGILGEMIMVMLVVTILWGLLTVGFQSSELTKGTAKSMFSLGKKAAKAIPFIPTGGKPTSFAAASKFVERAQDHYKDKWAGQQSADAERINQMLGLSTRAKGELSIAEEETIKKKSDFKKAGGGGQGDNTRSMEMRREIKKAQQTKRIPWRFVKKMTEDWLVSGGFQWAKNHQKSWFSRMRLPDELPENIDDIWKGESGNGLRRWINGFMDSKLEGTEDNNGLIAGGGKGIGTDDQKQRYSYAPVASDKKE